MSDEPAGSVPEASIEWSKKQAAERATEFVRSGMVIGLGTGSTAIYATRRIGQLLRDGALHDIIAVATSRGTTVAAELLGIPLLPDDAAAPIDLTIDGADEVSPQLDLIKGAGGALLREKMVAQSSQREIIVVDESKLTSTLGIRSPVPVEIVPFRWRAQSEYLRSLGANPALRAQPDGAPFLTDQGNFILDCSFGAIEDPPVLAATLRARAGIVEHGIFVGLVTDVIVDGPSGLRHLTR